jgi:hypothetical protein
MNVRSSKPLTAFSDEYLTALRERDEPPSVPDADILGPWTVREHGGRFCIFREWESFEAGHKPVAELASREDALIFASALRAIGRAPAFRVRNASYGPEGYEVERGGDLAGHLKYDRSEWVIAAHVLVFLAHSPVDLAMLLDLAGTQVQEMTGEILGQDLLGESEALS